MAGLVGAYKAPTLQSRVGYIFPRVLFPPFFHPHYLDCSRPSADPYHPRHGGLGFSPCHATDARGKKITE